MNTGYTIYQVERTKSAAGQREVDRSNAQLVAAISRLWVRCPVRVMAPRVSAETSTQLRRAFPRERQVTPR